MQWNLEQIRLFVSVAERQSFSAAARELKRVQSAVSNGIALLEADLGVTLFERSSGRQPRLTDEGRVLLAEAREVLRQCERLQGRALGLARGEEPRLRLAQDEAMPYQPVLDSLEALAQRFPVWRCRCPAAARVTSPVVCSRSRLTSACCSTMSACLSRWSGGASAASRWSRCAVPATRWPGCNGSVAASWHSTGNF